jgi:hypothetical protein
MEENLSINKFFEILNLENLTDKSVSSLAKDYSISERFAYLFKFRLVEFGIEELSEFKVINLRIMEILGVISLMDISKRTMLLAEFDNINSFNNPFEKIENFLNSNKEPNLLEQLSDQYWKCIYDYLIERSIDHYPFNLTSIKFIKSISKSGYLSLSDKQKNWVNNLITADFKGFDPNPIFCNSILKDKGLDKDFELISRYFNVLE